MLQIPIISHKIKDSEEAKMQRRCNILGIFHCPFSSTVHPSSPYSVLVWRIQTDILAFCLSVHLANRRHQKRIRGWEKSEVEAFFCHAELSWVGCIPPQKATIFIRQLSPYTTTLSGFYSSLGVVMAVSSAGDLSLLC